VAASAGGAFGYLWIKSSCQKNGSQVASIDIGSNDVEHVIDVENGAWTSSFDVRVETILPNSFPHARPGRQELQFRHQGATATSWTAQTSQIGPGLQDNEAAGVSCLAPAPCKVAIHSNVSYWDDARSEWTVDPTASKLAIVIDVK
jgi:hypothetical protein